MGIVTGAQRADVEFVLDHRGIAASFAAVVTEEDVVHGKPDPEGFELGAALLGVPPSSVLAFEDSLYGVRAARAAGMTVVGVVGTAPATQLADEADVVIDGLGPAVLLDVLERRGGADG
jgi:beta-phosphoglucomutase-like phosphatase (HAD superfamily)